MKKEIVIKVLKGVGAVVVTGLGIKAIVEVIKLKKQRDQLNKELCRALIDVKVHEAVVEIMLDENEMLFEEIQSLRESAETKKKKA